MAFPLARRGGMKWAIGEAPPGGKAVIETWKQISAEEAAQEAFHALATGDFERMKVLFITPQEMQALGMSAAEAQSSWRYSKTRKPNFKRFAANSQTCPRRRFNVSKTRNPAISTGHDRRQGRRCQNSQRPHPL